jgi:hypothetical protein
MVTEQGDRDSFRGGDNRSQYGQKGGVQSEREEISI